MGSGFSGFSPWFTALPIAMIAIYALLRANYNDFAKADKKAEQADSHEQRAGLLQQELTDCQKRFAVSQQQYEVFKDFFDEQKGRGAD